jgi:hypothetical protein
MFKSEKDLDHEEEPSHEKDDLSLFNLVRGGSKRQVNFLVTSAEGGRVYVPSRHPTLMINAAEENKEFKPRRGRSEKGKDDKEPDDQKGETHTRFATPNKKRTPSSSSSSGNEACEKPKRKVQKKVRSAKSNKQASVEGDGGLLENKDYTLAAEWAWGSNDAQGFKLAWVDHRDMTTTWITSESMGNGEEHRRCTTEEITTNLWKAVGRRLQKKGVGSPQRIMQEHRMEKCGGESGEKIPWTSMPSAQPS